MAGKTVFVSYSHVQEDWVLGRLAPCLKAGGAEVLIDTERMKVGKQVVGQMDGLQDEAESTVMVLSPEYLASDYCRHEMERAIARETFVPVYRVDCPAGLPEAVQGVLYADLRDDSVAGEWDKVLEACGGDLGADAPEWLRARDEVVRFLRRGDSVNLVVAGKPRWRALIGHVKEGHVTELKLIDLDDGATGYRAGLVRRVLLALGITKPVPDEPKDLELLSDCFVDRPRSFLGVLHFDMVADRDYGINFFPALRHLMQAGKLVLMIESRESIKTLLSENHPLSGMDFKTVELKGR